MTAGLRDLALRLARGAGPDDALDAELWRLLERTLPHGPHARKDDARVTQSLDACRRLHDLLLPGWSWRIVTTGGPAPASALLRAPDDAAPEAAAASAADPCRAWALAIVTVVARRARVAA